MNKNTTSKKSYYLFFMLHYLIFSVYNLGHPVTPAFINDIHGPTYLTGVLLSVMALAQFVFAPLWGQASDKVGRHIVFLGPIGYAIGQLGFIFFSDPTALLLFRFISGFASVANMTIHFVYISDISNNTNRTRNLGIAALLLPISAFTGFFFGGILGDLTSPRTVFLIQAILSCFLGLVLYLNVQDIRKIELQKSSLKKRFTSINFRILTENVKILRKYSDTTLIFILVVTLLNMIAFQFLVSQTAVILNDGYEVSMTYIGFFIACINLIAGVTSFFVQPRIFRSKRDDQSFLPILSFVSIIAAIFGISSFAFKAPFLLFLGGVIGTLLNTIYIAIVQDIIGKFDKGEEKGVLLGLNQSTQALGLFIGTFSSGFLVSKAMILPLVASFIMFFITCMYNLFIVRKIKKEEHLLVS